MGIDLTTYRGRIGMFTACVRPRRERAKGERYRAYSEWDVFTDFSARIMAFTFLLCAWWSVRACAVALLYSHCTVSLTCAFSGTERILPRSPPIEVTTVTDSGYSIDYSWLLILSGQVELNPGPMEREEFDEIMKSWSEKVMKKVELVAEDVRNARLDINNARLDISNLSSKIDKIEQEQLRLRTMIVEQDSTMDLIIASQKDTDRRIEDIEDAVEKRDIKERRDNVILYGVPESDNSQEDSVERFAAVVNEVLPAPLHTSDIVRAYRLGRGTTGRARPLLACLARPNLKIAILQRRKDLRNKGIGVSGDLTPKQRQQIQQARDQGLFAYFRGGVLHTEARHSRPVTRSHSRAAGGADSG